MGPKTSSFFVKELDVAERQIAGWSRQRKIAVAGVLRRTDDELTERTVDVLFSIMDDSGVSTTDAIKLPRLVDWLSTKSEPEKAAVRGMLLEMLERD